MNKIRSALIAALTALAGFFVWHYRSLRNTAEKRRKERDSARQSTEAQKSIRDTEGRIRKAQDKARKENEDARKERKESDRSGRFGSSDRLR